MKMLIEYLKYSLIKDFRTGYLKKVTGFCFCKIYKIFCEKVNLYIIFKIKNIKK